eukprot:EG_transcript_11848
MTPHPSLTAALTLQPPQDDGLAERSALYPPSPKPAATAAGEGLRLALEALQMSAGSGRAARTASGALRDLLQTAGDCEAALAAGAVPGLTDALRRHGACPAVVRHSLAALLRLAALDEAQPQLLHDPLLSGAALTRTLRQHKSHADVMTAGLSLLLLLTTSSAGQEHLRTTSTMVFTLDTMLTHPDDPGLQCLGCDLIHRLAEGPAAQQRLLALGAVEILVQAVRRFPQNRGVQKRALNALLGLCETEHTRTLIGRVGGVAATLHAVRCNSDDLLIARCGCCLLWELMRSPSIQHQVMTAEVRAVLKKVLNQHSQDAVTMRHGRPLLFRITGQSQKPPSASSSIAGPPPNPLQTHLHHNLAGPGPVVTGSTCETRSPCTHSRSLSHDVALAKISHAIC